MRRIANYLLLTFWIFCGLIYVTMDLWLDLYTYQDSADAAWYAVALSVPLAAYTLYLGRETFLRKWYYAAFSLVIIYSIYGFTIYFSSLNADLLFSSAFNAGQKQVLFVERVEQVFAKKAGFIHTDVVVRYRNRLVKFEGTRTSYYYLRDKRQLTASVGQSFLGNLYGTGLAISGRERWAGRWLYIKNWFSRYWWLMAGFALYLLIDKLRLKYYPGSARKKY